MKRTVRIADIQIDTSYRPDERHAMVIPPAPGGPGVITVAQRPDGRLFIIDGWGRLKGLEHAGVTDVEVEVIDTAGAEEEAREYITANSMQRPLPGPALPVRGERYARHIVYVRWLPGDQYRPLESYDELGPAINRADELAAGGRGPTDVKVIDLENLDLGDMRTAAEAAEMVARIRSNG